MEGALVWAPFPPQCKPFHPEGLVTRWQETPVGPLSHTWTWGLAHTHRVPGGNHLPEPVPLFLYLCIPPLPTRNLFKKDYQTVNSI